jgi:hypothetical protein
MMRLTYDPGLVEEAVLLSERTAPRDAARAFRRERDRVYDITDPDEREAAFQALHLRWFAGLQLPDVVESLVAERADIVERLEEGRVLRAVTRHEEGADLVDHVTSGEGDRRPILVLRLRPATLFEPEALRALIRHELMHVADMLDPAFGYERALPASDDGPSRDNIQRDRYRVLWDVTIDGRLARAGGDPCGVRHHDPTRDFRWQEFAATFSMLGDDCRKAFDEWFDSGHPTHAELVAFALAPTGFETTGDSGRCPLCRFPVASLDARPDRLSPVTVAAIGEQHPSWDLEQGLCSQCLDLYEARYGETSPAGCR